MYLRHPCSLLTDTFFPSTTCVRSTGLTSSLFLVPSGATGQDQPPATSPTQSIASGGSAEAVGGDRLGDIVVTARRREENAQTVPVSVTAFSGAALEQRKIGRASCRERVCQYV